MKKLVWNPIHDAEHFVICVKRKFKYSPTNTTQLKIRTDSASIWITIAKVKTMPKKPFVPFVFVERQLTEAEKKSVFDLVREQLGRFVYVC